MPDNYFARYIPLLIQFGVALVVAVGMVLASTLLGRHRYTRAKFMPYECGMTPVGDSRERFSVKFYLVGMLFILFDVEAVFLLPWAIVFKDLKIFGFVEMMVYIAILLVGLWYVWHKGVLDWAERPFGARGRQEILDLRHPTLSPAAAPPDPIVEGTKV